MHLTNAFDICMLVVTMAKGRGKMTLYDISLGLLFVYTTTTTRVSVSL